MLGDILMGGGWLLNRKFEEPYKTAIQTKIVPCPQFGLDTVFRNPNKNRGWPAELRKATKSAKLNKSTNRTKDYGLYAIFFNGWD
jgi:hypothetical protein